MKNVAVADEKSQKRSQYSLYEKVELLSGLRSRLTAGASIKAAAEEIFLPRTTAQDWLAESEGHRLPAVIFDAFMSPDGLDFVKRLVVSAHLIFHQNSVCGIRVLSDFFRSIGLNDIIGSSMGSQWSFGQEVEAAIIEFGQEENARLAECVRGKEITLAMDENFHEGPCLVTMEPVTGFILNETAVRAVTKENWKKALSPAISLFGVKVVQVTSDDGMAIIGCTKEVLKAHHSPDLFHLSQVTRKELSTAFRSEKRHVLRNLERAEVELSQAERALKGPKLEESEKSRLEELRQTLDHKIETLFSQEGRIARAEQRISQLLIDVSKIYHPVDLVTGSSRTPQQFEIECARIDNRIATVIEDVGMNPTALLKRLAKRRMRMAETLKFCWDRWEHELDSIKLSYPARYAFRKFILPAAYLRNLAKGQKLISSAPLRSLAAKNEETSFDFMGTEQTKRLIEIASELIHDFQRSSSAVEGRNGALSLRHHAFHALSDQKREVMTILHNYYITRCDGTTAAQRFFGVKAKCLFESILAKVGFPPPSREKKGILLES